MAAFAKQSIKSVPPSNAWKCKSGEGRRPTGHCLPDPFFTQFVEHLIPKFPVQVRKEPLSRTRRGIRIGFTLGLFAGPAVPTAIRVRRADPVMQPLEWKHGPWHALAIAHATFAANAHLQDGLFRPSVPDDFDVPKLQLPCLVRAQTGIDHE
jgi:hypothetical protein